MIELPLIKIKLKNSTLLAKGIWFNKHLVYFEDKRRPDSRYSNWLLAHPATNKILCEFRYDNFRLGYITGLAISQWDWRGSEPLAIPAQTRQMWLELKRDLELAKDDDQLRREKHAV